LKKIVRTISHSPVAVALLLAAACGDGQPTGPSVTTGDKFPALQVFDCTATVASASVKCASPLPAGASFTIIGGQNQNVRLSSSNVSALGGIFSFEVTVQNLLNEAMGTPDGVIVDTAGVSVFFASGPTVTAGTGSVTVANADGVREFTAPNQPFFRYNEVLVKDQVSGSKNWQLAYDPGVQTFTFRVYVAAELQPLLIINELLANPFDPITDAAGEWFEVYNAGSFPVEMQGMLVADSAQSGRRPYHLIASSLIVQPGGYVVLGNSTNTTNNGGVPVDYAYGSAMAFANSLDALKISRAYGATDTLTIDRTQYASAAISAQNGISRELKNPALDNANMDGSNWASALVTAVYGPGGRGTPKAQNSQYTP
jgi:hypothetical protein